MEVRDVLHGAIQVNRLELPILDSLYFQRLRHIKQLGFSEYSFPSASHNRYIHSLGAMQVASRAFDHIFSTKHSEKHQADPWLRLSETKPSAYIRLRSVVRLAALLHDVGHGPLSHTSEIAMPAVKKLNLPISPDESSNPDPERQATHEDYTLKILLDSSLTPLLQQAGSHLGFTPKHIASLIEPNLQINDDFFEETIDGQSISFRPILQQLISSELDADRMDYLRRDSLCAGVSYGEFDYEWLVFNLTAYLKSNKCYLAFDHKALYAFEDFLISRFHMFLMVYFHYKSVIYDEMLTEYFNSDDCKYSLPTNIEKYAESHDGEIHAHLAKSKNKWARRIAEKRPLKILMELHSGIPATPSASRDQSRLLEQTIEDLKKNDVHYILSESTGELSKYFQKQVDPIYVRYDNLISKPNFIELEKCTDLFRKYQEKRSITRIYLAQEDLRAFKLNQREDTSSRSASNLGASSLQS